MAWPKTILVRGLQFPVESWEEFDELVQRYGGDALVVTPASEAGGEPRRDRRQQSNGGGAILEAAHRALLQQFVAGGRRGVLTTDIGPALGARGKAIRPALERWSRHISLVSATGGSAFARVHRNDGRAYRLTDVHLLAAQQMLGMS